MSTTFLSAEWRKLLMINYAVDQDRLLPFLPPGTSIDHWKDTCYVSLVGFMFLDTALKKIRIPFHTEFEEVNLRFYVKPEWDNSKRGVVFIKEMVPKRLLSLVANTVYGEHYETLPMKHSWRTGPDTLQVSYGWKKRERWHTIEVVSDARATEILTGSEEEFITEHYWGYTKKNDGRTSEYEVQHPRWQVYPIRSYHVDVSFNESYGASFAFLDRQQPVSVFLAEGSEIEVKTGRVVHTP